MTIEELAAPAERSTGWWWAVYLVASFSGGWFVGRELPPLTADTVLRLVMAG